MPKIFHTAIRSVAASPPFTRGNNSTTACFFIRIYVYPEEIEEIAHSDARPCSPLNCITANARAYANWKACIIHSPRYALRRLLAGMQMKIQVSYTARARAVFVFPPDGPAGRIYSLC